MTAPLSHNRHEPRLCLFWFLGKDRNASRFVTFSRRVTEISAVEGRKRLSASHAEAWPEFGRLVPGLRQYDFDFLARGYVEFSPKKDRWISFCWIKSSSGAPSSHTSLSSGTFRKTDWSFDGAVSTTAGVVGLPDDWMALVHGI